MAASPLLEKFGISRDHYLDGTATGKLLGSGPYATVVEVPVNHVRPYLFDFTLLGPDRRVPILSPKE